MKIGYIRVSKQEQNEALQRDALKEAGCEKYFSDKITGSKFERKGLEELLVVRGDVSEGDRKDWLPMEKWLSLAICLPIRIIPFQRFARRLGSLVQRYVRAAKEASNSSDS